MTVYRRGTHRSQFDGSPLASENCTPASGANAAREASDGKYDHSGGYIRNLVKRSEETNPNTPGWSLADLDLAMSRARIPFEVRRGWAAVKTARAKGLGIVLPGDSDQFTTGCSAAFNGNHAVYIHPETTTKDGVVYWLLGDPICSGWRWEKETVLRRYAEKFNPNVSFGVFTTPVRELEVAVVQAAHTDENPALIDIAAGTVYYDLDGKTPLGKLSTDYKGRFSPFSVSGGRAIYTGAFGSTRFLRIVKSFTNQRAVPDATPYSSADITAAKTAGAQQEKGRLRSLLGL